MCKDQEIKMMVAQSVAEAINAHCGTGGIDAAIERSHEVIIEGNVIVGNGTVVRIRLVVERAEVIP